VNLFVKYLAPFIRNLPQITLSKRIELDIQNHCMKLLSVKDMGELRDRFEGQKFLDNALFKVSSYSACANFLGVSDFTIDEVMEKDKLSFIIDGLLYRLCVFNFGELPEIGLIDTPLMFVLKKDKLTFSICGSASMDVLNDNANFINVKGKRYFIGFENLSLKMK
jgi:hypothetical protein